MDCSLLGPDPLREMAYTPVYFKINNFNPTDPATLMLHTWNEIASK